VAAAWPGANGESKLIVEPAGTSGAAGLSGGGLGNGDPKEIVPPGAADAGAGGSGTAAPAGGVAACGRTGKAAWQRGQRTLSPAAGIRASSTSYSARQLGQAIRTKSSEVRGA
jgi:hypothetical protein